MAKGRPPLRRGERPFAEHDISGGPDSLGDPPGAVPAWCTTPTGGELPEHGKDKIETHG